MDHLPIVVNPYRPPVEVVYLDPWEVDVPPYDNHSVEAFSNFPERIGWNKKHLIRGRLEPGCHPISVATIVQQWLFFGLLSAFRRHECPFERVLSIFTRESENSGLKVVTTRGLEAFLQAWKNSLTEQDLKPGSEVETQIDKTLLVVQEHIGLYLCADGEFSKNHPIRAYPNISFSITALCVILSRAKYRLWPRGHPFGAQTSELVSSRLHWSGWCPSDISMLNAHMTPLGMYFVSMFSPRLKDRDHVAAGCDKDKCAIMNISEEGKSTYKTVHEPGCDGCCEWHRIDEKVLCEILSDHDAIAVATFEEHETRAPKLLPHRLDISAAEKFVAISHVWAEGLGHTTDNALPNCQLIRIQKLVDKVSGAEGMPFWIDTLSIPQDWTSPGSVKKHPEVTEKRQQAIRSMNTVYEKAVAVLVLDSELLSVPTAAPIEERLVRFVCSSWIRRLWTLNEAVLGHNVMLQFQDQSLDLLEAIFKRISNYPGLSDLSQTIVIELSAFVGRIERLREPMEARAKIVELWNACQFRSTSELQDEALCLAVFLKLPMDSILKASREDKWCAFIDTQEIFPKNLLFTLGRRINRDGYRWAPESCIRRPASDMASIAKGYARATRNGLQVQASGLSFAPPQGQLQWEPSFFWVKDTATNQWYRIMASSKTYGSTWEDTVKQLMRHQRLGVIANSHIRTGLISLGVLVAFKDNGVSDTADWVSTIFLATCNVMTEFPQVINGVEKFHSEEARDVLLDRQYCTVDGRLEREDHRWVVG